MQCPRCGFEDTGFSAYCEQCGTLLNVPQSMPDQTAFSAPQTEYGQYSAPPPPPLNGHEEIPPPPPPHDTAYSAHGIQSQLFSNQKVIPRQTIGIFSAILYFIGALIAALGLMGTVTTIDTSTHPGALALLLGTALFVSSVVIFISIRRRFPLLRWWQRILWIFAATFGGFIALVIEAILVPGPTVTNYIIGCVFLLYGIAWEAIAVW